MRAWGRKSSDDRAGSTGSFQGYWVPCKVKIQVETQKESWEGSPDRGGPLWNESPNEEGLSHI